VDFTRDRYAPLDLALAAFVLQIAGWLDGMTEEEGDANIAMKWLEDLGATVATVNDEGRARFREIAWQLARDADADPLQGDGAYYRQMAANLLGEPRPGGRSRDIHQR
jgi:hypothetical protein